MDTALPADRHAIKAAASRARVSWLDDWVTFAKPELERALSSGLDHLRKLDDLFNGVRRADDNKMLAGTACDFAGGLHNLLSNLVGTARKDADEHGINVDAVDLDLSALETELAKWELRYASRQASAERWSGRDAA